MWCKIKVGLKSSEKKSLKKTFVRVDLFWEYGIILIERKVNMEQLELFKKTDYVLFGLSFTMPEPGCFAWYEESDEDYLNPRSGYCYIEKLNDD